MNTFLSTSTDSLVACAIFTGAVPETSVLFTITINETGNEKKLQYFADVSKFTQMKDEKEVLFGMSSVFRVLSVEYYDIFWDVQLELTSCEGDANVNRLTSELKNYLDQVTNKQIPFDMFKQLVTRTSLGHAEPWMELVKYVLADATQLFLNRAFDQQGRMKAFIEEEPCLRMLVEQTTAVDVIHPSETAICCLLDMIQSLSLADNHENKQLSVNEKLRLFYKSHTCVEQQKFSEALNHWEEAVEIVSFIPSSMARVFNGAIYIQMAAAYFRMNNLPEALTAMDKALTAMKAYYPPTHRMFAGLGFLYGYHLLLNG